MSIVDSNVDFWRENSNITTEWENTVKLDFLRDFPTLWHSVFLGYIE